MKTSFTPPKVRILPKEMEAGSVLLGSAKQAEKIRDFINGQRAMLDAVESRVIFPVSLTPEGTKSRLHFIEAPEFCVACVHAKSGELNAITLAFENLQLTFRRIADGSVECFNTSYTLEGNGVGDTVEKGRAQCLNTLLMSDEPIALHARVYLRERTFGKVEVAA